MLTCPLCLAIADDGASTCPSCGLESEFAALVVNDRLLSLPLTTNFSTWYARTSLFGMIVVIVLAVYVFYISLSGQKVFTRNPLEE